MIDQILTSLDGAYSYLPGTYVVPLISIVCGTLYGVYRYVRSFPYLYYYYIEHGIVICWTDNYRSPLKELRQKYKLDKHYDPYGYIGGLGGILGFAFLSLIIGSLWPVSVVVGILTIPNFVLRHMAREKRAKVIFEQNLKGEPKK